MAVYTPGLNMIELINVFKLILNSILLTFNDTL